jgi:osmoprotectant transport system permease protein
MRIRKTGKQEGNKRRQATFSLFLFSCLPAFLIVLAGSCAAADSITVGSKKFTESYVLGEIAKQRLADAEFAVNQHEGMGGTIILWQALSSAQIDLYPEYTGTIAEEILKVKQSLSPNEMRAALAPFGVGMTGDLGFNNTYALVMRRSEAARLGIRAISDLQRHPELKAGLTHEFIDRQDGWAPLVARTRLRSFGERRD